MPIRQSPIDIIAYEADGTVVLLLEAKSRLGASASWAAKLRRNMRSRGDLPNARYFVIATPERIYGWSDDASLLNDAPPQFTVDAKKALGPYFARFHRNPENIGPEAFEWLVLTWLDELTRSGDQRVDVDPSLKPLAESGLLSSLQRTALVMNPER